MLNTEHWTPIIESPKKHTQNQQHTYVCKLEIIKTSKQFRMNLLHAVDDGKPPKNDERWNLS